MQKILVLSLIFLLSFKAYGQSWQWAKVEASTNGESWAISNDLNGNVYMGGGITGTAQIASTIIGTTAANPYSGFLIKYDGNGNAIWARSFSPITSTAQVYVTGVRTDNGGGIFVTGFLNGNVVLGSNTLTCAGGNDIFLAKYDSNGNVLWAKVYGGNAFEESYAICTDLAGNCFITGYFFTQNLAFGTYTLVNTSGLPNYFITKLDGNGNVLWAANQTSGNTYAHSIASDRNGNVFITGRFTSQLVIGTTTLTGNNLQNFFVAKYNAAGSPVWAVNGLGNSGYNIAYCVSIDPTDNVYVTGAYSSSILTIGANTYSNAGGVDVFLVKYSNNGSVLWARREGGTSAEFGYGLATYSGGVFVSGGLVLSMVIGTATLSNTNADGMFFAQYDSAGNPLYAVGFNGGGDDQSAMCLDNSCNLYLAGDLMTTPVVIGTTTLTHPANTESIFLAKFNTGLSSPSVSISGNFSVCAGNSATLIASGAPNYFWSNGSVSNSIVVSPSLTTFYSVVGYSTTGCINTQVKTVTVAPLPTVSVLSASICSGTVYTFAPTGATSYTFSSGSVTVSPLTTTTYSVLGTGLNGCVSAAPAIATVVVNPLPLISVNSGTICSGSVFTIVASGASTYSYSGGSSTVSPLASTSYSVIGTSSNGCLSAGPVQVSVTVLANPSVSVPNGVICYGQSYLINPSGAVTYSYTGGSASVTPLSTTGYTVTGFGSNGCSSKTVCLITVNPLPTVTVIGGSVCAGNSFTIVPSGALTYTSSSGNPVVTPSVTTTYSVWGKSAAGCFAASPALVTVTVAPLPQLTVVASPTLICLGESATITANGANSYTWSNGQYLPQIVVDPSVTTVYSISGAGADNCVNTYSVNLLVNECAMLMENSRVIGLSLFPNPSAGVFTIEINENAVLEVSSVSGEKILFQKLNQGQNEVNFSALTSGIYFVEVRSADGRAKRCKIVKE